MPYSAPIEPVLPAAWTDVLDRIQHVLAGALQAAEARAHALENSTILRPIADGDLTITGAAILAVPCEISTAETEQALASAQEALNRWLAAAEHVRQRLAEQAARSV